MSYLAKYFFWGGAIVGGGGRANVVDSFKCNDPLAISPKFNSCISDIRVWMITYSSKEITQFLHGIGYCGHLEK